MAFRRLWFALPLATFLGVAAYLAIGLTRDPSAVPSALIDKPVPRFALPPLPGHDTGLTSADLVGRPQLVNVFASWCVPCRIEHPLLMQLAELTGVTVRGINYKDPSQDALAWLERFGNPYASIGVDSDGRVAIEWGVYGVPETFLIDGDGRIRYKHIGPLSADDVTTKILPMIRELER